MTPDPFSIVFAIWCAYHLAWVAFLVVLAIENPMSDMEY